MADNIIPNIINKEVTGERIMPKATIEDSENGTIISNIKISIKRYFAKLINFGFIGNIINESDSKNSSGKSLIRETKI